MSHPGSHSMNFAILIALAALTLPTAALAQEPERIRPGTPLDTAFIAPRTDSVAILTGSEDDMVIGYAVFETRTHVVDGVRRVVNVQRQVIAGDPEPRLVDSAHLHWGTLLPISAHTRGATPRDMRFGPGSVRFTSLPRSEGLASTEADSTTTELALAEPVFYVAVVDLLLRALPLRVGYRAVLPGVTDSGELSEMRVTVTGEETARALDGAVCPVLVVEVEEENLGGTFFVSPVNRAIIRIESEFALLVRPAGCP
jgi:hypothetical protein